MIEFSKPAQKAMKPKTLRDARKASKKNFEAFTAMMTDTFKKFSSSKKDLRRFKTLIGSRPYKGKILASDAGARFSLQKELVKHVDEHQRHNPSQRVFFITFMSDEFRTTKKRPRVWVKRLRRKTDKTLRMLCKDHGALGAIGMPECAFVKNSVDERKELYQWHSHALIYTDKDFDFDAARRKLHSLNNWRCASGIDPIRIKEITSERGAAAYWAYYLAKLPVDAKNIVERDDGSFKVMSTKKGYRPDAQLRLFEGLSQIPLQELIFAVGDAKFIRDPVIRNVKAAKKVYRTDLKAADLNYVRKFFKSVWRKSRADHKRGWFIAF